MNDDDIDQQLREGLDGDIPSPDPAARRRAIAMARQAFEAEQAQVPESNEEKEKQNTAQGIPGWLRLIFGQRAEEEGTMTTYNSKLMYSGVATAAVMAVAVGLALQTQTGRELTINLPGVELETEEDLRAPSGDADEALARSTSRLAPEVSYITEERRRKIEASALYGRPQSVAGAEDEGATVRLDIAGSGASVPPGIQEILAKEAAAGPQVAVTRSRQEVVQSGALRAGYVTPGTLPADVIPQPGYQEVGRDKFIAFEENRMTPVSVEPVSTFSADVDTASYSFVRRMLNRGVLPQPDAVRAEEMINYFDYSYALPESKAEPFAPSVTVVDSPWADGRKLMHIGIKGYDIAPADKPRSNLVFLLDVSGSMNSPDKLPLVKQSMEMLLSSLDPDDTVAIAVYAGAAGLPLRRWLHRGRPGPAPGL